MRLPTFQRPPVQSSPARDCLCLLTMFPGRQAFEAWKKSTRRPRTAIQVIVAFVVPPVFCAGPDLWGSFGRYPGLGTPASSMHPGRACNLVRPRSAHPSRAFHATWWLARVHPSVQPHLPQALCVEILGYGYDLWRSGHAGSPVRLERHASAPAQACRALHSPRRAARFRRRAAVCPPAHDRSSPPQMHGVGPEMTRLPPTARVGPSGPARH